MHNRSTKNIYDKIKYDNNTHPPWLSRWAAKAIHVRTDRYKDERMVKIFAELLVQICATKRYNIARET